MMMAAASVVPLENCSYQLIESRKRPLQESSVAGDDESGDIIDFKRDKTSADEIHENMEGECKKKVKIKDKLVYIYLFFL